MDIQQRLNVLKDSYGQVALVRKQGEGEVDWDRFDLDIERVLGEAVQYDLVRAIDSGLANAVNDVRTEYTDLLGQYVQEVLLEMDLDYNDLSDDDAGSTDKLAEEKMEAVIRDVMENLSTHADIRGALE